MTDLPLPLSFHFLTPSSKPGQDVKRALIILNQPFSASLFRRLWDVCDWRCCADGGANRLYTVFDLPGSNTNTDARSQHMPDIIKGDLDSILPSVRQYYASHGVPVVQDDDQDTTDLQKCIDFLSEKEATEGQGQYEIILLGGLSGRLDQTIHTLSLLHKLRKTRKRIFAITDDNIGCVLDEGEHLIQIDHSVLGPTCGLLPVGIDATVLSTTGLKWDLTDQVSSFDGLVSTSNHLIPEEEEVWIKTSKPIWWTVELKELTCATVTYNK